MPHLKEEKIGPKVQRCLDIWEEREVFDADYIQVCNVFSAVSLFIYVYLWGVYLSYDLLSYGKGLDCRRSSTILLLGKESPLRVQ